MLGLQNHGSEWYINLYKKRIMINILPNWHPILVHFTIALYTTSFLLYCFVLIYPEKSWTRPCLTTAYVNLWLGGTFTILTVIAGFYAFSTIDHPKVAHEPMQIHRNWALVNAFIWWGLALWTAIKRPEKNLRIVFFLFLIVAMTLLTITGLKGGNLVYRYGVGVKTVDTIGTNGNHHHNKHDTH